MTASGSLDYLPELPEPGPVGHATSRLKRPDSGFGFIISALPTESPWIGVSVSFFNPWHKQCTTGARLHQLELSRINEAP